MTTCNYNDWVKNIIKELNTHGHYKGNSTYRAIILFCLSIDNPADGIEKTMVYKILKATNGKTTTILDLIPDFYFKFDKIKRVIVETFDSSDFLSKLRKMKPFSDELKQLIIDNIVTEQCRWLLPSHLKILIPTHNQWAELVFADPKLAKCVPVRKNSTEVQLIGKLN